MAESWMETWPPQRPSWWNLDYSPGPDYHPIRDESRSPSPRPSAPDAAIKIIEKPNSSKKDIVLVKDKLKKVELTIAKNKDHKDKLMKFGQASESTQDSAGFPSQSSQSGSS
jgi:hypothetical protein